MKLMTLICCFLLVACATPPETRTQDFYRWYTGEKNKLNPAVFDASPLLANYVAPQTLKRLQKIMTLEDSDLFDADYFTCAQDVSEKWPGNVIVSPPYHVPGGVAVNVMLGAWDEPEMLTYLIVYLVQHDGQWMISRVKAPTYEQYLP